MSGFDLTVGNDIQLAGNNVQQLMYDCTIDFAGASDRFTLQGDGTHLELHNCSVTWAVGTAAAGAFCQNNSTFKAFGTSFTATTNTLAGFMGAGGQGANGGFTVELLGCDLDAFTGYILQDFGATYTADDGCDFYMEGCSVANITGFVEEAFTAANQTFTAVNCDGTAADAEWQFYQKKWNGEVEVVPDNVSGGVVRNSGGNTFSGGRNHSLKITTNSRCSTSNPFHFDIPAKFMALSNTSTDGIRLYFAQDDDFNSGTKLSDTDIWFEALAPDTSSKNLWNRFDTRGTDFLGAGTAHTEDSGGSDWENNGVDVADNPTASAYWQYYDTIDTSTDACADSVPMVRVYVAVDTSTYPIFLDGTIDTVAT